MLDWYLFKVIFSQVNRDFYREAAKSAKKTFITLRVRLPPGMGVFTSR